jgi:hypothetical protein
MAHDVLHPLSRKAASPRPKSVYALLPVARIGREDLIERRDNCMADIQRLCAGGQASRALAGKARRLLTAHWATSSWRARANLLRTAEWLLRISRKAAATCAPWPDGDGRTARGPSS